MSDKRPEGMIHFSVMQDLIAKVQGRVKHIHESASADPKFIPAMETVEMCLQIINHYATWTRELRAELTKCSNKNQEQAEMIRSLGGIKAKVQ